MKSFKSISIIIIFMTLFSSCTSAQKLQSKAPMTLGEAECQSWVAGIDGGGSGINLFIPVLGSIPKNIQFDSVYFRGKVTKLEVINGNPIMLVGRFKKQFNQKKDIVMSSDLNAEYGNEVPILEKKIPFNLKDTECVISFKEGDNRKYFKINNIIEKQPEHYPSAPPIKE